MTAPNRRRRRRRDRKSQQRKRKVRALNHESRRRTMRLLRAAEEPLSPMRIAQALDLYASGADYHVRCLEEEGLVTVVEESTEERGVIEHFYELAAEGDAVVEQVLDETESEDKPS